MPLSKIEHEQLKEALQVMGTYITMPGEKTWVRRDSVASLLEKFTEDFYKLQRVEE